MSRLLLVDLSGIVHRIWHVSTQNPDPDHTSVSAVARVRALAHGYDYVAICCDSPRSYRKDIAPTYKANRPPAPAALKHQLLVAKERLIEDGYACFEVDGFEADDVIATLVRLTGERDPAPEVVIASADKDLHQLIDDRVAQLYLVDNTMMRAAEVQKKFGIGPHQMRDWLVLVGDDADNIKGVHSIGPKGATKLLERFGSLYTLMREIGKGASALGLTPAVHKVLAESAISMEVDRRLISLNADAPIDDWERVFISPNQKANDAFRNALPLEEDPMNDPFDPVTGEVAMKPEAPVAPPATAAAPAEPEKPAPAAAVQSAPSPGVAKTVAAIGAAAAIAAGAPVASVDPKLPEPAPMVSPIEKGPNLRLVEAPLAKVEWSQELEPRSLREAMSLAAHMHASKLFSQYGNAQGVLATILAGRELKLGTMASLRGFHIIDNKPYMSAGLMNALVLQSGKQRVFSIIERSNQRAVLRAWRKGADETALDIVYSLEDARLAQLVKAGGGWEKNPADMCVARCIAIGARLKFADVCFGLYTPEEMGYEVPDDVAA